VSQVKRHELSTLHGGRTQIDEPHLARRIGAQERVGDQPIRYR
jgi:hypothetical protein